jgi:predicted DNA-binding transcriptional regulator AlpA
MTQPEPLRIDGSEYFSATQIVAVTGISRQTLWRWRHEGKVPPGHRFRDRLLVFTAGELEQIRQYANRVEPIAGAARSQLSLFTGDS